MVARSLFDHAVFAREPMTEREAWVWLIMEASWKPRKKRIGNTVIDTQRGQLGASVRFLAAAWGWSAPKVQRYLNRIEKMEMIRRETDTGVTVVTICNYDMFQNNKQTPDTAAIQQRYSSDTNEKKGEIREEGKKVKEEPSGSPKKSVSRQVPSDFQPTSSGMEYAVAKGMPAAIIPAQVEKFILHHQSKGSTFKDVGRAWQTWCLNYASFRPTASNVVDHPRKAATDVTKYHPLAIDMGGGWWTQPGGEVEWYRDTNECRADKRTRDLQAAEEAEALRGAI